MAGWRTILTRWRQRFRPVSTPGPAATAVPADRSAELSAELRPSLALLEDTEAEAGAIREQAQREAARIRGDARREAARIEAAAAERAPAVRQQAAEHGRQATVGEAADLLAGAERDAAAVRQRALRRIPDLADQAVGELLGELGADPTSGEGTAAGPARPRPPAGPGSRPGRRAWWAPGGLPG